MTDDEQQILYENLETADLLTTINALDQVCYTWVDVVNGGLNKEGSDIVAMADDNEIPVSD